MTDTIPTTVMSWMCQMAPLVLQDGNMDNWDYLKQRCTDCMPAGTSWNFDTLCTEAAGPDARTVMQSALVTATQWRRSYLQSVLSEAQGKQQVHDTLQGIKKAKLTADVAMAQSNLDALAAPVASSSVSN